MTEPSSSPVELPTDLRSGPVVVGLESVEASGRMLRAAGFVARTLRRQVLVVHVRRRMMPVADSYLPMVDDLQLSPEAEQALDDEMATALRNGGNLAGVDWQLLCVYGEASVEVVRIADDRDAAMVVVGKRQPGFADVLHRITSGSVSRAVVSSHKFPVLVVP